MNTLHKIVIVLMLALVVSACAVSDNLSDGYEPGDVSNGLIENRSLYCSAPYRGLRAVGRFVLRLLGAPAVPDICVLIDEIKAESDAE